MSKRHSSLLTAAAIMALGAGLPLQELRTAHRPGYRPTKPKRDSELQREIADWNAAVEAKKKAKKGTP